MHKAASPGRVYFQRGGQGLPSFERCGVPADHVCRFWMGAFERHIGNSLTEMQRKHFLAFSQHYGLPTNLLDFTFSPLISLYFSCGGEPGDNGYVYFIKKDRLIDISENLELINSVILSRFLFAPEELEDLFRGITDVFLKEEAYIFEFLEEIDRL